MVYSASIARAGVGYGDHGRLIAPEGFTVTPMGARTLPRSPTPALAMHDRNYGVASSCAMVSVPLAKAVEAPESYRLASQNQSVV